MSLRGTLSLYPRPGQDSSYPYFASGAEGAENAVVFIGGLTNGLMNPGYLPDLSKALEGLGWQLVQMHWSSAYDGYGTGSLDRDVAEMEALVLHLLGPDGPGIRRVVLMGHSTGCQDVMRYLSTKVTRGVVGGIMQAPVSDREGWNAIPGEEADVMQRGGAEAEKLVKDGKGDQLMGPEIEKVNGGKITAYRLWSLMCKGGDDDYFSEDIPDQPDGVHAHPLSESFGNLAAPVLALHSGDEQYYDPKTTPYPQRMERWAKAAKHGLEHRVIDGAEHGIKQPEGRKQLGEEVTAWLSAKFGE